MMEGNKTKPRALLLFGAPGSGKTTFGEKFAQKFNLVYYDLGKLAEENQFNRKTVLVVLEQILKTKQTVILEGGLDTEKDRIEIRNLLRSHGYEPTLVWIQTDISTIRMRLKTKFRSVKKAKEFYDNSVATIEAPAENEKAIILSGKHTFETQARHVLAGLAELTDTK